MTEQKHDDNIAVEKKKKKKKIPWAAIFNIMIVLLTIGMITYFIFSKGGFIDLLRSGLYINPLWFGVGVFVHLANIAFDATVIYLFIRETTPGVKIRNAIAASMVGQFYCAVTPSATGGQPMQILTMSRMGIKAANATSALVQKFLVWQFTLTVYSVIAFIARFGFFMDKLSPTMWVFTIIGFTAQVAMICVLLLASFSYKATVKVVSFVFRLLGKLHIMKNPEEKITGTCEQLRTFNESNKELNKKKSLLVQVYAITAVQMTSFFLVPFCIAMAFGVKCNVFDMLCAQAYVNMVSSLMPLPGGSGAAEYCFGVFFSAYFSEQLIKSAILLWRTISYYGTIIVSLPFAGVKKKTKIPESVAEITEAATESAEEVASRNPLT